MAGLTDAKDAISAKYLNKHGIHAVGLSRRQNAVTVYVTESLPVEVSNDISRDAAPYRMIEKIAIDLRGTKNA